MTSPASRPSPFDAIVRSVLTHPLALAMKRRLRDARWRRRGDVFRNPAVPGEVRQIVFVCLGNICRSPFAAVLMQHRLAELGIDVTIASAGLNTRQGNRPPDAAVRAAHRYGCDLDGRTPVSLSDDTIAASDMIVAMEMAHIEQLQARWPEWRDRYFLLPLFEPPAAVAGAFERFNLADPFGKDDAEFARCYERIDRAVAALLPQLRPARR
jgi:low molecular weight protein-tyrosine phosphatase